MSGTEYPEGDEHEIARLQRQREADRPLEEAGEGESEGFELAEEQLIDHASHGDQRGTGAITRDSRSAFDAESAPDDDAYGEADEERLEDSGRDED